VHASNLPIRTVASLCRRHRAAAIAALLRTHPSVVARSVGRGHYSPFWGPNPVQDLVSWERSHTIPTTFRGDRLATMEGK
jgi:hypothetical protein